MSRGVFSAPGPPLQLMRPEWRPSCETLPTTSPFTNRRIASPSARTPRRFVLVPRGIAPEIETEQRLGGGAGRDLEIESSQVAAAGRGQAGDPDEQGVGSRWEGAGVPGRAPARFAELRAERGRRGGTREAGLRVGEQ